MVHKLIYNPKAEVKAHRIGKPN